MNQISRNCIVCAEEFDENSVHNTASSKINVTWFKICQSCLDLSDPQEDYKQAREIVNSYLTTSQVRILFEEAKDIINNLKK